MGNLVYKEGGKGRGRGGGRGGGGEGREGGEGRGRGRGRGGRGRGRGEGEGGEGEGEEVKGYSMFGREYAHSLTILSVQCYVQWLYVGIVEYMDQSLGLNKATC